jgi:iron complex outermembrane receptor protein
MQALAQNRWHACARVGVGLWLLAGLWLAPAPCLAQAQMLAGADQLGNLSLEQLSNVEVTSVSKSGEQLRAAPAAIYVISHDDILRAGVTSIAEALRLAPNLQILQYSSSNYIAGARGFAGAEEAQNFSNKLLILIDGRSVYSPLYSGVYLDVQDLLMEDIDRIEVISGPGATLWGANAMNGVINIITRPAYLTDKSLVSAGAGNREQTVSGRYAGKAGEALSYRVYGKMFRRDAEELADGSSAFDAWEKAQGGFRADWTGSADSVTAQGDLYRGTQSEAADGQGLVLGGNVLGRWQHHGAASDWQVQAYYDETQRTQRDSTGFSLRTYDIELQQSLNLGWNHVVWGAGTRLHRYHITNSTSLLFEPDERSLVLGDFFGQDTIALSPKVDLTLGLKLERDPYSDWTPLPDLRLAWRVSDSATLWGSAARAIRAPTPFDDDVQEKLGGSLFLTGNQGFKPEQVDAFEIGYRGQPLQRLSWSASVFYNLYDDLRTIEPHSSADFLPLMWGNLMRGKTYGLETWGQWQATDWWRLSPGLRMLRKDLEFKGGSAQLLGLSESGDDPRSTALLRSSMDITRNASFDATLRYVGTMPDPHLASYCELDAALNGKVWRQLELSLSGLNLIHASHLEYPAPSGEYIRRSVILQARWTFQ